jgi:hypothetical protein
MAVQTPPVLLVMAEDDLRVERQTPTISIGRHHPMAVGARIDAGRKGRRRNLQSFLRLFRGKGRRLVSYSLGSFLRRTPATREEVNRGDQST